MKTTNCLRTAGLQQSPVKLMEISLHSVLVVYQVFFLLCKQNLNTCDSLVQTLLISISSLKVTAQFASLISRKKLYTTLSKSDHFIIFAHFPCDH